MSTELKKSKRVYRQKERAKQQNQTHENIVAAIVELHKTAGPAQTTISEIAKKANVGRMTVYKHFPDEYELFSACGMKWSTDNPFPDFDSCMEAKEFGEKCRCTLEKLYKYFKENQDMLSRIMRDVGNMPELKKVMDDYWYPVIERVKRKLLAQVPDKSKKRKIETLLDLLCDYRSWELMTRQQSEKQAAQMGTELLLIYIQ